MAIGRGEDVGGGDLWEGAMCFLYVAEYTWAEDLVSHGINFIE
jgi:hypothetical protein